MLETRCILYKVSDTNFEHAMTFFVTLSLNMRIIFMMKRHWSTTEKVSGMNKYTDEWVCFNDAGIAFAQT